MRIKNFNQAGSLVESKNINQQQKLTKGGFKMKPTRFLIVALVLLGMVATASALTPANTPITNQATGTYKDANNNVMYDGENAFVTSNEVTTIVSQVAGVGLGDNLAQAMSALSSTLYDVTITNSGNGTDFFTIGATGASDMTGSYSIEIFHDANNNGQLDGTEGDAVITQTSSLPYSDTYDLLIRVTDTKLIGSPSGETHVVTLTATSNFPSASDQITLTTTLQAASVNGETTIISEDTPAPGEVIIFETCFTNSGDTTAYDLVFSTEMPSNTSLVTGSVSIDGGNSYITIPSTGATYVGGVLTLDLGDLGFTAPDNKICVRYSVEVDDPLDAGLPIEFPNDNPSLTYDNEDGEGGSEYPVVTPTESEFPAGGIVVEQTYAVALTGTGDDVFTGDPSDSLVFSFKVINNGNGGDTFNLGSASDYVVWEFYPDLNGDGVLDATDLNGGPISATAELTSGDSAKFFAVGVIPSGTPDTEADASTFTATSQGLGTVSDTDTAATTCTAPVITLVKSVSPAGNQPPGTILTYQVIVVNSGTGVANTVVVSDAIPTNTTYQANSLTIDGSAAGVITDASDGDGGTKTTNSVVFEFDTMSEDTGATDTHTLTFKVAID